MARMYGYKARKSLHGGERFSTKPGKKTPRERSEIADEQEFDPDDKIVMTKLEEIEEPVEKPVEPQAETETEPEDKDVSEEQVKTAFEDEEEAQSDEVDADTERMIEELEDGTDKG